MIKKLKIAVLSDLHMGHEKNTTEEIINNLVLYFEDYYDLLKDVDIFLLTGDEFDRMLTAGSSELLAFAKWMTSFFTFCQDNNIKVRIVDGTKSHGYTQMKTLLENISNLETKLDVKFYDELYIEHFVEYDFNMLYVPDEVNHDASITFKQIQDLMRLKNLTKVDFVAMHGQFHYQLPMITSECSHTEEDFLNITNYFITAGHIHKHSIFSRIVMPGSFDRISHGEEGSKGGLIFELYGNMALESGYVFLENKNAKIFKTIKLQTEDPIEVKEIISDEVKNLKNGSRIRLKVDKNSKVSSFIKDIRYEFKHLVFDLEKNKDKKTEETLDEMIVKVDKDRIFITKDNICELIITDLLEKNIDEKQLVLITEEIKKAG